MYCTKTMTDSPIINNTDNTFQDYTFIYTYIDIYIYIYIYIYTYIDIHTYTYCEIICTFYTTHFHIILIYVQYTNVF